MDLNNSQKENTQTSEQVLKPKHKLVSEDSLSEDQIKEIMRQCGVPKRFLEATKEKIIAHIWQTVSKFLSQESLYIYGKSGVGKTYIIASLIREIVKTDIPKTYEDEKHPGNLTQYLPSYPRMISVPDLLLEIRESFRDTKSDNTEGAIIHKYTDMKSLIMDDLGAEKTTDWSLQTLYLIVDRRYRNMQQTVITSNLTLDEVSKKIDDRIASRIVEMCKVIEIKGRDRRVQRNI